MPPVCDGDTCKGDYELSRNEHTDEELFPYVNDNRTEPTSNQEYYDSILNASLSAKNRLGYINTLWDNDQALCSASISHLLSRYIHAHIGRITTLISLLCSNQCRIPMAQKYNAVEYLKIFSDDDELYKDALKEMTLSSELSSLSFHMTIKLFEGVASRTVDREYAIDSLYKLIFSRNDIHMGDKFRIITKLIVPNEVSEALYLLIVIGGREDAYEPFDNVYKILASQRIMDINFHGDNTKNILGILCDISMKESTPYDQRADAADTVIHYSRGNDEYIEQFNRATQILNELSHGDEKIRSLYTDKQNVHDATIMDSVREMIVKVNKTARKLQEEKGRICL